MTYTSNVVSKYMCILYIPVINILPNIVCPLYFLFTGMSGIVGMILYGNKVPSIIMGPSMCNKTVAMNPAIAAHVLIFKFYPKHKCTL